MEDRVTDFTPKEREAMKEARLAVFHGAIIVDAQPPIDDTALRRIAKHCVGPIPAGLVELWSTAFGGKLLYDASATFGTHHIAKLSLVDLFFPGGDGYEDLDRWLEHEQKNGRGKKLDAVPFGGFTYQERVYALCRPGASHGSVAVWQSGVPPSWPGYLHEDSLTHLATDVGSMFQALTLNDDPWTARGSELVKELEKLASFGDGGRSAARKLTDLLRARVLNWRAALDEGTLGQDERLARLALEEAAREDDVELFRRIEAQGVCLHTALWGMQTAFDIAARSERRRIVTEFGDRRITDEALLRALRNSSDETALLMIERSATTPSDDVKLAAVRRAGAARRAGRDARARLFESFATS
ncbi:MAG: hypothetical protein ACO1OB_02480 [Archangium sp.]